jgi:hypothetical protein
MGGAEISSDGVTFIIKLDRALFMAYFRSLEGVGALLCCLVPLKIIPKITSHAFSNLGCALWG